MTPQGRDSSYSTTSSTSDCETKASYSPLLLQSSSFPSSPYGSLTQKIPIETTTTTTTSSSSRHHAHTDSLDWNEEDILSALERFGGMPAPLASNTTQPPQHSSLPRLVFDSKEVDENEDDEVAPTSAAATRHSSIHHRQSRRISTSVQFREAWKEKQSKRKSTLLLPLQEEVPSYNTQRISTARRNRRSSQVLKTVQARARWAKLRDYVTSGEFWLHSNVPTANGCALSLSSSSHRHHRSIHDSESPSSYQQACFQNTRQSTLVRQRRSSLARGLQKEIQTDYQWSLRHCFLAIAIYLASAIGIFSFLLPMLDQSKSWTMIDSMYFAVVTFTTIGYGDLTKSDTPLERFLACVFALAGVSSLGMALGVLGARALEWQASAMERAEQNVMTFFSSSSTTNSNREGSSLPEHDSAANATTNNHNSSKITLLSRALFGIFSRQKKRNDKCHSHNHGTHPPSSSPPQHNSKDANHHFVTFVVFLLGLSLLSCAIGSDAGWDWTETLYFAITTSCTIGYGDKVPVDQWGRMLVVCFIPFAVGAMGWFLQYVAEYIIRSRQRSTLTKLRESITILDLEAMDENGDGLVSWSEFLEFMLCAMNKVDQELLWELKFQFDSLDVENLGVLSKQNLISLARRREGLHNKAKILEYKQQLLQLNYSSRLSNNGNGSIDSNNPNTSMDSWV